MIVMRRQVTVDHKIRTDINYPAGFQDVVSMPKCDENFRLLFNVKGNYVLHKLSDEESRFKLCKVIKLANGSKASIGHNPFHPGQSGVIPYAVTHDGRTIRYVDPAVKPRDTVKFDLQTGKITAHIKFEPGNVCMITAGANKGRVGIIVTREKHPGSFEIVHLKDRKGNAFATRSGNVFVIGEGAKPWISLPRGRGIKLTIEEEKEKALSKGKKE